MASSVVSGDDCECGVPVPPVVVDFVLLKASHGEDDSTPATTLGGTIDTMIAQEPVEPAPWPVAKPTWWAFDVYYYRSPPPLPLEMAERQVPVEVWNDFWIKVKATKRPLLGCLIFIIFASMLVLIIYAAIVIRLTALWGLLVLKALVGLFISRLEQRLKQLRYTEDGAFRDYGFSWTRHIKTVNRDRDSSEHITVLIFHDDHAHSFAQRDDIWTIDLHNRDTIPALPEAMVDRLPLAVWTDFWIKIETSKRGSSGTTASSSFWSCLETTAYLVCLLPIILFPALALVLGRKAAFVFLGCLFSPCLGCSCDSNSKDYDQLCQEEEATFRQYGFSVSVLTETNKSCCEDDKSNKKLLAFQEVPVTPEADVLAHTADFKRDESLKREDDQWTFELRNRNVMPVLPNELSSRIPMAAWKEFWLKVQEVQVAEPVCAMMCFVGFLVLYVVASVLVVKTGRPVALLGYIPACFPLFLVGLCNETEWKWKRLCREHEAVFQEFGLSWTKTDVKIESGDNAIPVTFLVFQELGEKEKEQDDDAV